MLYAFFWVIPRRLSFICRRFGTLFLFHLHRQVGMNYVWVRGEPFPISISQHLSNPDILHTYPPMKMEQIVYRNVGI